MPDEDGITLLSRIRALGETGAGMPALAISAHVREEDRRRALAGGFEAVSWPSPSTRMCCSKPLLTC